MTVTRATALAAMLLVAPTASAQNQMPIPFGVGEKMVYDVKFGPMKVGTGSMQVQAIDTLRGVEVFHTTFRVKGGTFFYKVNDLLESWFDTKTLASLRFRQDMEEGGKSREKTFDIFPERSVYLETGKTEKPSVSLPLDDANFLYFIRTVPLVVGETYEFNRYFRPDRNPVRIKVLRKERIEVPAGKFDAIVVQPIIKAKGIFSENGHAEVWIADDSTRIMLQMKSRLSFGTLNLYLKSFKPTPGTTATPATPE